MRRHKNPMNESEVFRMVDQKTDRSQKVNHILHIMDCQYRRDTDSDFWIDNDRWHLSMPDDEPDAVYINFTPKVSRDVILETAVNFSVTATLMGLAVYPAGTIAPDSTDAMAGWIEQINNK
jgi:hypothetical protein